MSEIQTVNKFAPKTDYQCDEICLLYGQGLSTQAVADVCGTHARTVRDILQRRGIPRRPSWTRACNFNVRYDCFAEIDDEESAYWLGFLYADGCVHKDCVRLVLADREHVLKFRAFIGGEQKICNRKGSQNKRSNTYQYICGSARIVQDLVRHGCMPRKRNLIRMPNFLPGSLVRHFVRGFNDGDGSIYFTGEGSWRISICGNQPFLLGLQQHMMKNCDLLCTKLIQCKHSLGTYDLAYSGNLQVPRIVSWLYQDATVYLDRKYAIAMRCLEATNVAT